MALLWQKLGDSHIAPAQERGFSEYLILVLPLYLFQDFKSNLLFSPAIYECDGAFSLVEPMIGM